MQFRRADGTGTHPLSGTPIFFLAYATGLTIDQAFITFLSAQSLSTESSLLSASALVMCCSLPRALLLIPAGVLADRIGSKRCISAAAAMRLVPLLALAVLWSGQACDALPLAIAAFIFGSGEAIFLISSQSWIVGSSSESKVSKMQSIFTVVQRICSIAAPALFGIAASLGPTGLLGIFVCISLLSLLLSLWTPPERERGKDQGESLKVQLRHTIGALRSLVSAGILRRVLLFILVAEFITAALFGVGYAGICDERNWSEQVMSLLLSTYGIGAAIGALVGEPASKRIGVVPCSIGASISLAIFCGTQSVLPAALSSLLSGIFIGAVSIQLMLIFVREIYDQPNKSVLISALSLASFGAAAISPILFSVAAEFLAPTGAFVLFAVALALTATLYGLQKG